jgi:hypothetical protein
MIDEDFQYFLHKFGPQIERREAPPSSIERYRKRLPDRLLDYWQEFGWAGYAEGLFWIVNPQEYEGVLEEWLSGSIFEGKDDFHVIAMNAFGELYVWGELFGFCFSIIPTESYAVPRKNFVEPSRDPDFDIHCFFLSRDSAYEDIYDLFSAARSRLGGLKFGEVYGFRLAPILGGAINANNLEKTSAVEYLSFLAQLDELEILQMPE